MKKFTFLTKIIILFTLFFISCDKEEENLINDENHLNTRKIENSLSFQEIAEIAENFGSDYASFSSDNSYYSFINSFYDLSEMEKIQILEKLKYETIDAFLDGLLEQIDKMQTREEVINFIDKNSRYLKLERKSDGEEYVEFNNYSEHSSNPFFNRDQIIKVGEVYLKYVDDICVKGEDITQIRELDTKEKILNSSFDYFVTTNVNSECESYEFRWGDLMELYEWEKVYNPSWCINDRKVELHLQFISSYFTVSIGNKVYEIVVKVDRYSRVRALRKGYPCIWYVHKDNISWNNFLFEYDLKIDGVTNHYIWSKSNMTQENIKFIVFKENIFNYNATNTTFDCQWTIKRSSTTTDEMNGIWLKVDE